MSTYTLVNTTDVLTNADWTFDASNFLVGAATTGITIGAPTGGDEANSVNVAGGYYVNGTNLTATYLPIASPTFTGTLAGPTINATTTLEVGGSNINTIYAPLASPTFTGTATAPTVKATSAFDLGSVNIVTGWPHASSATQPAYATASTTALMLGLAVTLTPLLTGTVLVISTVYANNSGAGDGVGTQLQYGTGSAPAQGATLTGTNPSNVFTVATSSGASASVTLPLVAIISGLTVGTAYWFDLGVRAITAGTATINAQQFAVREI